MNDKEILLKIKLLNQNILKELSLNNDNVGKKIPTPTQMRIIDYIIDHKNDEIYQKDLEKVLGITRATVSDVLNTMEKNNFIKRESSNNDKRTNKIVIQKEALDCMKKGEEIIKELEKIIIKDISIEDLKIFNEVLNKMNENLESNSINNKEEK